MERAQHPVVAFAAALALAGHYRQQDQQRMAEVYQQADSLDWNGQVFERMEDGE